MPRLWFLTLTAAAFAAGLAGPVLSKDFSSVVGLPKNSVLNYAITHSITKASGAAPASTVTATVRYHLNVDPNDKGYMVRINFVSADLPPGGTPDDQARLQHGMAVLNGLQFQAANDLSPVEIVDWRTQVGHIVDSLADTMGMKHDDPAMTATRNLYLGMTGEQATNALLPEWVFPTIVQNIELDLGPAVSAENTQALPGGAQVKTVEAVQLKSVDAAGGKAYVSYHSAIDPASANAMARATIQAMQAQVPGFPRFSEADLASLKMEQSTDCAYEMDAHTGLSAKSDCTKIVTSVDDKGAPQRQTDRWIITQELARP